MKPWYTETSSIHVYLEVDDEAFAWLKEKMWMSAIGLHLIRWSHVPVRGITGYIAPDEDVKTLKEKLYRQNQEFNTPPGTEETAGEPQAQVTPPVEIPVAVATPEAVVEDQEDLQEIKEFQEDLTPEQEAELLQQAEEALNTTMVHVDEVPCTSSSSSRTRSPTQDTKQAKSRRKRKPDGTAMPDPSDMDSDSN